MELPSRLEGNVRVLSPRGRIDHAHADDFHAALVAHLEGCRAGGEPVVLDFSGVEYISSVGLRVLMLASRQVAAQDGCIAMAALTPLVREVFEISRFNLVFRTFDSVAAAVAALAPSA
ncbi:MAG TPA: STAS domain-containing protein [Rhodocyclaceae bacterium]|nr:STAS domain-containing protein [Rhodocyclaceae bacterium]